MPSLLWARTAPATVQETPPQSDRKEIPRRETAEGAWGDRLRSGRGTEGLSLLEDDRKKQQCALPSPQEAVPHQGTPKSVCYVAFPLEGPDLLGHPGVGQTALQASRKDGPFRGPVSFQCPHETCLMDSLPGAESRCPVREQGHKEHTGAGVPFK